MKKACFIYLLFLSSHVFAQMTFKGQIDNIRPDELAYVNVPFDNWYHPQNTLEIAPRDDGSFSVELPVEQPQTIFFDFRGKRTYLYAAPGDLLLQVGAEAYPQHLEFKGSLAAENALWQEIGLTQKRLGQLDGKDGTAAPAALWEAVKQQQADALQLVSDPDRNVSERFRRITRADIHYFPASFLLNMYSNRFMKGGNRSIKKLGWKYFGKPIPKTPCQTIRRWTAITTSRLLPITRASWSAAASTRRLL